MAILIPIELFNISYMYYKLDFTQSSYDIYNNGFYYSYNDDNTLTLLSYDGNSEDIIIPGEYDGSAVTVIADSAFSGNVSLESVVIGENITTICDSAFSNCLMLTTVTIGESVTYIGDSAFENCYKLVEVCNLSLLTIKTGSSGNGYAGYYAKNVYTSASGESHLLTKDGCMFVYDSRANYYLISYTGNYSTLTLPDLTVNDEAVSYAVYKYAFYNNDTLTTIVIPDCATAIGENAFCNCTKLKNVTVGGGVTSIGDSAFGGCSALQSITLPFVGGSASATSASTSTLFGYIFGTSSYTGGMSTKQYYSEDDYVTYYIPSTLKEVTITGGDILYGAFYGCSAFTNINIPESITSIGACAFYNCSMLDGLNIPEGVTAIGERVFCGCSALDSVNIPEGVTAIGERAFYNCSLLTEVTVPDSVTSIGSAAFGGCSALQSIVLPFVGGSANASSASSSTLFGYIFGTNSYTGGIYTAQYYSSGDYNAYYIPSALTTVTITGGDIFYGAFYACRLLTNVTIGDGVNSIGTNAFRYCYKLVEVQNLSSLTIEAGSTDNGYVAYYAKNVYTAASGQSNIISQDDFEFIFDGSNYYLFNYKGTDSQITLPALLINNKSVNYEINQYAFYRKTALTSVTIPYSGVTSIGACAFESCSSLTSVSIGSGVTSIGDYAFEYCSSLTSVSIGSGVTSIGAYAFHNCSSLTSIAIGNSVSTIGNLAFYNCSALDSVYITDLAAWCTITYESSAAGDFYLDTMPFYYASDLYLNNEIVTSLVIPGSVTSISAYAFYGCSSISNVTIHSYVTSIGTGAFSNCAGLTEISVSTSNTHYKAIDGNLYNYDGTTLIVYAIGKSETSFEVLDGVITIGNDAFYGATLTNITLSDTVTKINASAFRRCKSLTSITITANVTSIEKYAFEGCDALTDVTFNNTSGWYVTTTYGSSSGTSVSVTNSSTNASRFINTYMSYYWYRSE